MNRTALFFAFMSLLFAALFGADLLGYFNRAQNPVAVLGAARGNVRRLGKDQLTWDRAPGGTQFGGGDTIATGEDSRAKLMIYAGGELELEAGSMVVLGDDLHELKLNFITGSGKVRVTKAAKGKIAVERKVVAQKKPARAGLAATSTPETAPAPVALANVEVEEVEASEIAIPPPPASSAAAASSVSAGAPVTVSSAPASAPAVASAKSIEVLAPEKQLIAAPAIQEKSMRHPEQGLMAGKGEVISLKALPPMPQISAPGNDAVISMKAGTVPKLEWSVAKKTGADAAAKEQLTYEVIIRPFEGNGPEKILRSDKPSLPLERITQGKYLWAVRAVNAEGKRGPSSVLRGLQIRVPEQIGKPLILPVKVE